jgi:hypothetical protein
MASRSTQGSISLPRIDRRSMPVTDIPQVQIPLINGGAAKLLAIGAITRDAALTVSAIDQKNQEMAAEKEFSSIFLEAQKEIADFHATATGDEDISGQTLAIYEKYMNLEGRNLPAAQAEIVRGKLVARQTAIGQQGLDFELKLKSSKYDADLNTAIENSANIVAGDPRMFKEQLAEVEQLIGGARLNGAEKADRLDKARGMMGRTYLMKLSQTNPALARKEIASGKFDAMVDPASRLSIDSMIEGRFEKMENDAERERSRAAEKNSFDLYTRITEPQAGQAVSRQEIVDMVRAGDLKPSDGRTLINLMMSDESKEDDLQTFAELSQREALGTLTPEDVITAQAAGNLKTSTAKSLISGITTGLNSNETYKTGRDMIRAEFDKTDFGVTKSGSAAREAEALREFQRRAAAPQEGETIDGIAEDIVKRLRGNAKTDTAYRGELTAIRREMGVNTESITALEAAADRVMEAAARGTIGEEEKKRKLATLQRKIMELESKE